MLPGAKLYEHSQNSRYQDGRYQRMPQIQKEMFLWLKF